ncbi:hypothetical protein [Mangrovimonas xylaniphaga]|uniref:hypothetical protein n=1 Tax=Mangrovimonas xylaniphaga TaxID=1645915 RepID=UPI0006B4C709|nr:hypothetical protein [Mangrovimonas xylaniphaga]
MFFLTDQDPNYRIKGSRDPLGFQPIWQSLGRKVVKYLSTVSVNLKDFQVLSYGWYFYGDRDPKDFLKFFLKFEQAFGFARGIYLKDDSFNGVDFVRKNTNQPSFQFSNRNEHTLLSNQKSYGIYGKYNRPFTEMRIKEHDDFRNVMEASLKEKVDYDILKQYVSKLLNENVSTFTKKELIIFSDCVSKITEQERQFYKELILRTDDNHVQNEVFNIFQSNPEILEAERFNLYGFLDVLSDNTSNEELKKNLTAIKYTEQILAPFSYLFRTLQSEPVWSKESVTQAPIFDSFPEKIPYQFDNPVLSSFNECFYADPFDIALAVIKRNQDISDNRRNAAWLKQDGDSIIICYADGARRVTDFELDEDFENNYFLPTYISLYRQILLNND